MPTGYTAELMEKGMDFSPFVLQCARAFGAFVTMRDDPMDAPIPEKFEPSDYHVKALAEAIEKHKTLSAMTNDEKIAFGEAEKETTLKHHKEWLLRNEVQNKRLHEMILQVQAWRPPTEDHEGLKKFMLDQIQISLNDLSYISQEIAKIQERNPISFYIAAVSNAIRSIEYHTKENVKEIERAKDRTEWVRKLRLSL
jgi:hypothetical protein